LPVKPVILTKHARLRLRMRAIDRAEVEYALDHASVKRSGRTPGTFVISADMALGRILGVVYKETDAGFVIISAYWRQGQP